MSEYWIIGIFSVCLSCVSQTLLKKSTLIPRKSYIREYFNIFVVGGYMIMGACVFLTIYMSTGLELKYGAIIESMGYIVILVISKFVFNEKITFNKICGNILIIAGIVVFNI